MTEEKLTQICQQTVVWALVIGAAYVFANVYADAVMIARMPHF
jgi:hypothetical protein